MGTTFTHHFPRTAHLGAVLVLALSSSAQNPKAQSESAVHYTDVRESAKLTFQRTLHKLKKSTISKPWELASDGSITTRMASWIYTSFNPQRPISTNHRIPFGARCTTTMAMELSPTSPKKQASAAKATTGRDLLSEISTTMAIPISTSRATEKPYST